MVDFSHTSEYGAHKKGSFPKHDQVILVVTSQMWPVISQLWMKNGQMWLILFNPTFWNAEALTDPLMFISMTREW